MLNDNKPLVRYQLVQINVPAGSTVLKFNFPNQPDLAKAKIQKISTYHGDLLTKTPDGVTVISSADMCNFFLVLYIGDKESITIAMNTLTVIGEPLAAPIYNSNGYIPFDDLRIDWSKSYVQYVGNTPYSATAFSIPVGVFYQY